MNFLGMGPWMIGKLSKQYNVASPRELLEAAQAMGVEFIPCQMTMDMFGLKADDMIEGLGEPAGAADRARAHDRSPAPHRSSSDPSPQRRPPRRAGARRQPP